MDGTTDVTRAEDNSEVPAGELIVQEGTPPGAGNEGIEAIADVSEDSDSSEEEDTDNETDKTRANNSVVEGAGVEGDGRWGGVQPDGMDQAKPGPVGAD